MVYCMHYINIVINLFDFCIQAYEISKIAEEAKT